MTRKEYTIKVMVPVTIVVDANDGDDKDHIMHALEVLGEYIRETSIDRTNELVEACTIEVLSEEEVEEDKEEVLEPLAVYKDIPLGSMIMFCRDHNIAVELSENSRVDRMRHILAIRSTGYEPQFLQQYW